MVRSEWSEAQSDVTEEVGSAAAVMASTPVRRCVVPRVQPSAINWSDQRVPVYWDQTVPVWCDAAGSKRKKSTSSAESSRNDDESGPGQARRGGGGASSSSTSEAAAPEVSFDAILSMYESSLVEKSFTRRVLSPRGGRRRSRSSLQQARRDDDPRLRQFAVISASEYLAESEMQSLRATIERTTIRNSTSSSHYCNVILLERRRRRSWQDPLSSFPPRAPLNFAEAGA